MNSCAAVVRYFTRFLQYSLEKLDPAGSTMGFCLGSQAGTRAPQLQLFLQQLACLLLLASLPLPSGLLTLARLCSRQTAIWKYIDVIAHSSSQGVTFMLTALCASDIKTASDVSPSVHIFFVASHTLCAALFEGIAAPHPQSDFCWRNSDGRTTCISMSLAHQGVRNRCR